MLDKIDKVEWSDEVERRVRGAARSWVRRFGMRVADGEDFEQDAVLLAFEKVGQGKISKIEGIGVMVRNLAFDWWKKSKVVEMPLKDFGHPTVEMDEMGVFVEEVEESFPELVACADARFRGYSWDEIGEAFGETAANMRTRWSRQSREAAAAFGVVR